MNYGEKQKQEPNKLNVNRYDLMESLYGKWNNLIVLLVYQNVGLSGLELDKLNKIIGNIH